MIELKNIMGDMCVKYVQMKARKAGHLAAQQRIEREVNHSCDNYHLKVTDRNRRSIILDLVEQAGFPRCLLTEDKRPDPIFCKSEGPDDDGGWSAKHIWAVSEVEAFRLAYTNEDEPEDCCWFLDRGASYSGPGRPYSNEGYVFRPGNHIIHCQSGGWDV